MMCFADGKEVGLGGKSRSMALEKEDRIVLWREEVEPQTKVAGGKDWNGMRLCGNTDDVADRFGGVGQPEGKRLRFPQSSRFLSLSRFPGTLH